jgi:hypothetical protein
LHVRLVLLFQFLNLEDIKKATISRPTMIVVFSFTTDAKSALRKMLQNNEFPGKNVKRKKGMLKKC